MSSLKETTLFINLNHLAHNYHYLKSKLSPNTKFMGVVKAFAYGSDMVAVGQKLENLGADYLAVAYVREGALLRENGIKLPIMVLHPQVGNLKDCLDHCLEPSLYATRVFEDFLKTASDFNVKSYPIHLKFNTGLNRLGFTLKEVNYLVNHLKSTQKVSVKSVLSHLAATEDPNEKEFTLAQIRTFDTICNQLIPKLPTPTLRHILNTSGILNYPQAQYEMVRSGIGIYGFGNHESYDRELKPVATLKTVISQIHLLKKGESLGYNRGLIAPKVMKTATLPIGHADGLGRYLGKGAAAVSIHGKKAPIIGNVCMDMIMVDVTEIDCAEGDEVEVFGSKNKASDFAEPAGTISYEILTSISQRVKRIVQS